MVKETIEGNFSSWDGLNLSYSLSKGSSHAPLLVIVHGFGEHKGRYDSFVETFQDLDITFARFDLRGHGESEGPRVHVKLYSDFVADLERFLQFLEQKEGLDGRSFLLFGHSLGGGIAANFAALHAERVRSLILSSPCIEPQNAVPFFPTVAALLGRFLPELVLNNPVPPVFLSHDPAEIKIYQTDPLIQRRISCRLGSEMYQMAPVILRRAYRVTSPLYVLVAGKDRIVKNKATREFYDKVSSKDKKWIEFEGFYHEIFKESEREKPFRVLRGILEKLL